MFKNDLIKILILHNNQMKEVKQKEEDLVEKGISDTQIKMAWLTVGMCFTPPVLINIMNHFPAWLALLTFIMLVGATLTLLGFVSCATSKPLRASLKVEADKKLGISRQKQTLIDKYLKDTKNQQEMVDFFSNYKDYEGISITLLALKNNFLHNGYFEAVDNIGDLIDMVEEVESNKVNIEKRKQKDQQIENEWKNIYSQNEEENVEIEIGDNKQIKQIL